MKLKSGWPGRREGCESGFLKLKLRMEKLIPVPGLRIQVGSNAYAKIGKELIGE